VSSRESELCFAPQQNELEPIPPIISSPTGTTITSLLPLVLPYPVIDRDIDNWKAEFRRCISGLAKPDRDLFRKFESYQHMSIHEIEESIKPIYARFGSICSNKLLETTVKPIIQNIRAFGNVLDVIANATTPFFPVLWGLIKLVIEVISFSSYHLLKKSFNLRTH
jgi:hypothetical protein